MFDIPTWGIAWGGPFNPYNVMVIRVAEFSNVWYKIRKVFA